MARKLIVHSSRPPLAKRGHPSHINARPSLNLHRFEQLFKRSESTGASSDAVQSDERIESKENISFVS